jgi:ribosomal protein L21E
MARAQAPANFLGTITAISGTTLTVKTDAGQAYQVEVPAAAAIKRIALGEKDLSKAETIQFTDLAVGDRALVKIDPDSPAGTPQALRVIAVKQGDVAAKQQKDREDWQRNGVGGLVKSVDSGGGVIVLTSGSGATAKTITVHTTSATTLKRYAPASVSFDAAVSAPISAIQAGDQLRARGTKNADGTSIDAVEVVSGTFRNISGTVLSTDPASSTLVVKDLATKKQVTIHITPDVQMRKLPDQMAAILAMRLKGGSGGGAGAWSGGGQAPGGAAGSTPRPANQAGGQGSGAAGGGQWQGQGGRGAGGGGDPQQMLSRAPAIQIADLKKGDAVMVVSTDGTTDVTAITLLAGVEPLLEAPAASQSLLNNWSMGSGGQGAADAQAQ